MRGFDSRLFKGSQTSLNDGQYVSLRSAKFNCCCAKQFWIAGNRFFMSQVIRKICLLTAICFAGVASVYGEERFGERCGADTLVFEHGDYHGEARHQRRALNQIGILRISRSSDPWFLFEEFAKRLSVVEAVGNDVWPPRGVRSIIKTGGGNRDELAFVLLNLFTSNGLQAELLHVYDHPDFSTAKVDRVLVHLPAFDLAFDPTLPPAEQHKGSSRALLSSMPRTYRLYPVWRVDFDCPGPLRGYYGKRDR